MERLTELWTSSRLYTVNGIIVLNTITGIDMDLHYHRSWHLENKCGPARQDALLFWPSQTQDAYGFYKQDYARASGWRIASSDIKLTFITNFIKVFLKVLYVFKVSVEELNRPKMS